MKKLFVSILFFVAICPAFSQQKINIIPQPAEVRLGTGEFVVTPATAIVVTGTDPEVKRIAGMLNQELKRAAGFELKIGNAPSKNAIHFKLVPEVGLGKEGYRLKVGYEDVEISANQSAGLFYGLQSLLQLLPPQIESKTLITNIKWSLPVVEIKDVPRFGWRGQMLDVSRHFFTKSEVMEMIDDMSKYKYNLMHYH
jgi:hexosaminidase